MTSTSWIKGMLKQWGVAHESPHHRDKEAPRESEQTLRMFVDHASDAFFLLDDDWVFLDVNRQACLSLGYTREELVGMTPAAINPDITPSAREDLDRRLDAGEVIALESWHRRKDGTVFPVEVRAQSFREDGRRFGVALAHDVSDRKRAEEALRKRGAVPRHIRACGRRNRPHRRGEPLLARQPENVRDPRLLQRRAGRQDCSRGDTSR